MLKFERERTTRPEGLPIFRSEEASTTLFYAPGYLAVVARARADEFAASLREPATDGVASRLLSAATAAEAWRLAKQTGPYRPVCLTLYLHNACQLQCRYCFADAKPENLRLPSLSIENVKAAARVVAENCKALDVPFTLVAHGGGEPTLALGLLERALDVVETIAGEHGLALFRYVATNGVLTPDRVRWLARRFDLIGISCDGPPEIQDAQRPRAGGGGSAAAVEATARVLHDEGREFDVRVTVTEVSVTRLPEIAHYVCSVLRPREIHVEPVYSAGRAQAFEQALEAKRFVDSFVAGKRIARVFGVPWLSSGSRPADLHGPYCHVFRDVLQLVPGGTVTNCFLDTGVGPARASMGSVVGDQVEFKGGCAEEMRTRAEVAASCRGCFNQFHCVRECPDRCALDQNDPAGSFRCEVQRRLTLYKLAGLAGELSSGLATSAGVVGAAVPRW